MDADWIDAFRETDDRNEQYGLLRDELARLRGEAEEADFFDPEVVPASIRRYAEARDGDLVVFVANDFGVIVAYRPDSLAVDVQDAIREEILAEKYQQDEDLDAIRRALLADHPRIHKAVVAEHDDGEIRYHLPEGSTRETNFLTVREMVGLVDYTTNSAQRQEMSRTY